METKTKLVFLKNLLISVSKFMRLHRETISYALAGGYMGVGVGTTIFGFRVYMGYAGVSVNLHQGYEDMVSGGFIILGCTLISLLLPRLIKSAKAYEQKHGLSS